LLALKVMRLTRPTLYSTLPVICDTVDLPGDSFNEILRKEVAGVHNIPLLATGDLLMLPQSFGNIYLGEIFSCYVSVHNDSDQVVYDVSVKADLQTTAQRIPLSGQGSSAVLTELAPDQSVDDVIHHEVKEIGVHILVCAVSYATQANEKLFFRKFFKFQVLKPLDVKTKFYNAESDEVYLEAQVQNITSAPICLDKVSLEPSTQFTSTQLNTLGPDETSQSVFGSINYLNPMDSRQYLYCLSPKLEIRNNPKILKGVTSIGKLDIVWKYNMGEQGRLQTSQLQRMAPGYGDIRLIVEDVPNTVQIEEPFTVRCRVENSCERSMNLVLVLDKSTSRGLQWTGLSGRPLGNLEPDCSMDIQLDMVPITSGFQTIAGARLIDTFLKRVYDYDDLAQVYVKD